MNESFSSSTCSAFVQSECKNRNSGFAAPPAISYKRILFFYAFDCALVSDLASAKTGISATATMLRNQMDLNIEEIMFNLTWAGSDTNYNYDFLAHPVFNYADGTITGFNETLSGIGERGSSGSDKALNDDTVFGSPTLSPTIGVFVSAAWELYPFLTVPTNGQIFTSGTSNSIYSPIYLATPPPIPPIPPFPPDVFNSNLASVNCPVDSDGSHTGQCFKIPYPSVFDWYSYPFPVPPGTTNTYSLFEVFNFVPPP